MQSAIVNGFFILEDWRILVREQAHRAPHAKGWWRVSAARCRPASAAALPAGVRMGVAARPLPPASKSRTSEIPGRMGARFTGGTPPPQRCRGGKGSLSHCAPGDVSQGYDPRHEIFDMARRAFSLASAQGFKLLSDRAELIDFGSSH